MWNERCWTRAIIGELQAALADCNEAIRLEPNVAAAFDSRGLTYLKLGQWELAIADFNSALRLDPKLASSLYGRGFAKLKKGDLAGGNADIAAAKTSRTEYRGGIRSLWAALAVYNERRENHHKIVFVGVPSRSRACGFPGTSVFDFFEAFATDSRNERV